VHHRVEALQVDFRQIAEVFPDFRNLRGRAPEIASGEQIGVQAGGCVPSVPQNRPRDSANIPFMAG
jgi:hypothetical protein